MLEVGDGIARVSGLSNVKASELVEFRGGVLGIAFNLEEKEVGKVIGFFAKISVAAIEITEEELHSAI